MLDCVNTYLEIILKKFGDRQKSTLFEQPVSKLAKSLLGKRVRIHALKDVGSAHLLNGLTGRVIALHPIAEGWVKLVLDMNVVTPHRLWSVSADRLVRLDQQ